MRNRLNSLILVLSLSVVLASCNSDTESKTESGTTPESMSKEWCELNEKVLSTTDVDTRIQLDKELVELELKIEAQFKNDSTKLIETIQLIKDCQN